MGGVLRRPGTCVLGVLVLSVMIVATPAGRRPFWSSDEARFALLARDALDHGGWVLAQPPRPPYLNKPPLFFLAPATGSGPLRPATGGGGALPPPVSSPARVP